jgi:hypothetical protein
VVPNPEVFVTSDVGDVTAAVDDMATEFLLTTTRLQLYRDALFG